MVASNVVRSRGRVENVQNAFRILAGGAEAAAEALIDVVENSPSDTARVTAATAILDRMGISAKQQIDVNHVLPADFRQKSQIETVDPSATIGRRLLELQKATEIQQQLLNPVSDQDDIVDAILVEEV